MILAGDRPRISDGIKSCRGCRCREQNYKNIVEEQIVPIELLSAWVTIACGFPKDELATIAQKATESA